MAVREAESMLWLRAAPGCCSKAGSCSAESNGGAGAGESALVCVLSVQGAVLAQRILMLLLGSRWARVGRGELGQQSWVCAQ